MRLSPMTALALACFPAAAFAYQTTDQIMWPAQGIYPAYPREVPARPVQAFVSGGLYHDSNLFRLSDGANTQALLGTTQRSDDIRRFGAGLKADLRFSQQHLLLNARIDDYRYSRFSFLDHTGYNADATWRWRAGRLWSGNVGYARRRLLSAFGVLQAPVRDMITETHAFANANRMLSPRWRVRGGVDRYGYNYSNPQVTTSLDRSTAVTVGGDYVTPQENSVGAQEKYTVGRYAGTPGFGGLDNRFHESELSAVASWRVTGKSQFVGRIGYTNRKHEQLSERDYHGVTGRLDYAWTPGAKTLLNFAAWRELEAIENALANYALSQGVSFGPHWAPTLRTVVQANVFRLKREYLGDAALLPAGTPERVDTVRGANLSFGYSPRRFLRVSLGLERGTQGSNYAGGDYTYDLVSANARFLF